MSDKSTTFTKFDRNRFRKIYPRIKFPESISFKSTASIVIESKTFDFDNADSITGDLTQKYTAIPNMVIGVKSESNEDKLNVNVFISSVTFNAATGIVTVTIKSSDHFSGKVDLQTLSIE